MAEEKCVKVYYKGFIVLGVLGRRFFRCRRCSVWEQVSLFYPNVASDEWQEWGLQQNIAFHFSDQYLTAVKEHEYLHQGDTSSFWTGIFCPSIVTYYYVSYTFKYLFPSDPHLQEHVHVCNSKLEFTWDMGTLQHKLILGVEWSGWKLWANR